jgi:hypothetical protein
MESFPCPTHGFFIHQPQSYLVPPGCSLASIVFWRHGEVALRVGSNLDRQPAIGSLDTDGTSGKAVAVYLMKANSETGGFMEKYLEHGIS